MRYSRLWSAAAIIGLALIVSFAFSVPKTRDIKELPSPQVSEKIADIPEIVLNDSFKKGVHTISGSLIAPNACATVTADASSDKNGISIALVLSSDTGVCLQLPTKISFRTTISAPSGLPIVAIVNGVTATTTTL